VLLPLLLERVLLAMVNVPRLKIPPTPPVFVLLFPDKVLLMIFRVPLL